MLELLGWMMNAFGCGDERLLSLLLRRREARSLRGSWS